MQSMQLDLIAKVNGVWRAEEYEIPDAMKDKRTYGSLLNVYLQYMMEEKTEDMFEQIRKKIASWWICVDVGKAAEVSAIIDEMKGKMFPLMLALVVFV